MKKQLFKITKYALALIAIAFTIAGITGFIDISCITGVGIAMAGGFASPGEVSSDPVTTDVTKAKSSSMLLTTIDQKISLMRPDKYPFDTILREMGVIVPIESWETKYYASETRPLEDTVATTLAASNGSQALWKVHSLIVTTVSMWNVDDNIMVQGINGNDDKELILHITAKNNDTSTLSVEAMNGIGTNDGDVPEILAGTKLTRVGNAKSEKDAQTTPYHIFPQPESNYCQIHMAQVEESLYQRLHKKEVPWNFADFRSEAIWDMRGQMELASLFGVKGYVYDTTGADYKYMSGGAIRYITEVLSYGDTLGNTQFVDIAKSIFTGNNGSDVRVVFAGSGMRAKWGAVPTINKQMEQRDVEVVWGVKFNRIETDFGTLLMKHHPLLNYAGYTNHGIVLDMSNIEKHVFKSLESKSVDFAESGQRKTNADIIDEAFCTVYKNTDTHKLIKYTADATPEQ